MNELLKNELIWNRQKNYYKYNKTQKMVEAGCGFPS